MNRKGLVLYNDRAAGVISENSEGYVFEYSNEYCSLPDACSISVTLPLTNRIYRSKTLFSFFDGLIPEGWLLEIAEKNWKLDHRDRMGLLLACCRDCIGAVSVQEFASDE